MSKEISKKKKYLFSLIIILFCLAAVELSAFTLIWFVNSRIGAAGVSGVLINDDTGFSAGEISEYYANRDPVLGWPSATVLASDRYDPAGARPDPAFPYPQAPCAAVFGDSFAWSQEVDNEHAWPHRLSKALGCRVANYGVGGYGTGQAYLRFKMTNVDPAKLVILGVFPDNIMRNVNQYRGYLVAYHNIWSFKPRFILNGNELTALPIIDEPNMSFREFKENPGSKLSHEYFLPDTAYGPVTIRFPYILAVVKALLHPRTRAVLSGKPSWVDFYDENHASQGLQVTIAIIEAFLQDVRNLGKTPLIYVFTNARSVDSFRAMGTWPYQSLLDHMKSQNIPHLHFGDHLAEFIDLENICEIFTKQTRLGCTGHYTPDGYSYVARTIFEYLQENGIGGHDAR